MTPRAASVGQACLVARPSDGVPYSIMDLLAGAVAICCLADAALSWFGRPSIAARKGAHALAGIAAAGLWLSPALHGATGRLFEELPQARPPRLEPARHELPSVLLVVTESVRAIDYCSEPRPSCNVAPAVNALLPHRVPLRELRAVGSYTVISVAAIATGQVPLGSREQIRARPTVFDFVRALDPAGEVTTAHIASDVRSGIWELDDVDLPIDVFVAWPDPEDERDRDTFAIDAFAAHVESHPGPSFTWLQLYDTHAPYWATHAPFQPATTRASWKTLRPLHQQYKNAIFTQDALLARALSAFIETRSGPWVILFTSDHGDAFGEHAAIHHGQNLYDEQIHVPGFVAFGDGALSPEQLSWLHRRARGPTSHLDLLPTILDLYGAWDRQAVAPYRATMPGSSLLREPHDRPRSVPMTSCSALNDCSLNTWGMLGEWHALVGQVWDAGFSCVPLDDGGKRIAWTAECAALGRASKAYFPLLPNKKPNR